MKHYMAQKHYHDATYLVQQVGEVSAGEPGRAQRNLQQFHLVRQLLVLGMYLEDVEPPFLVWHVHRHLRAAALSRQSLAHTAFLTCTCMISPSPVWSGTTTDHLPGACNESQGLARMHAMCIPSSSH